MFALLCFKSKSRLAAENVAQLLDEIARRGVSILLVEQKLTIALKISHAST
jgi:branched-chain amino acid transport system ATP-binding protein